MHLQYTLIFIFINLYCFTCSPYYINSLSKRETPKKYCGSRLTSAMNLVCRGRYYGPNNKRSTHNDLKNMKSDFLDTIDSDYSNTDVIYPYVSTDPVFSLLLPKKIQKSFGIVNECCYNPCTTDTMSQYCALN
ncbi:bombyxin F-1-like [Diabrotica virgifera virgifera]|uniref:Bombyxin F-1-like n=1 Tax=Diabrotica virgifera virgifera TaxID=50390 RepID=A0A6P7F1N1_DIAVI|nr:bombyxin F-1-like [Diabrotica virgifera virgifera]